MQPQPQPETARPKMGSKFFCKIFHKIFAFLLGHTYVNTNLLKFFKYLRKINFQCRNCKNVQHFSLKQIFCKVLFKRDLWSPKSHFQCYFQRLNVLAYISKKIENLLRFGVWSQLQPQQFCCGNLTARWGMIGVKNVFFSKKNNYFCQKQNVH